MDSSVPSLVLFVAGAHCQVAGWGDVGESRHTPKLLKWTNVAITDMAECRVKTFLYFLKNDIKELTGSDSNSKLTWENLEKLGHSKSYVSAAETIIYRPINNRMHICAGDTKTDTCQVITFLNFSHIYGYAARKN